MEAEQQAVIGKKEETSREAEQQVVISKKKETCREAEQQAIHMQEEISS